MKKGVLLLVIVLALVVFGWFLLGNDSDKMESDEVVPTDVIEQEATRDIYAAGAVQAGDEDDYFQSSLFTIARRRILWLLILVFANK